MERPNKVPAHGLIYELPSIIEKLDLNQLFPVDQMLEVELGSGDGSFLVEYAGAHRERNFIGVERLLGRIRKMSRKAARHDLANVKGVRIECGYFLEYLLPEKSICALHIYFPDPWPKRKHRENRLIDERFPALAASVLQPGGSVYLRTDDDDYFEQMRRVFSASPLFHEVETPSNLTAVLTDFERDFRARGKQTHRVAYRAR